MNRLGPFARRATPIWSLCDVQAYWKRNTPGFGCRRLRASKSLNSFRSPSCLSVQPSHQGPLKIQHSVPKITSRLLSAEPTGVGAIRSIVAKRLFPLSTYRKALFSTNIEFTSDGTPASPNETAFHSPLPKSSTCTLSADVYRLVMQGDIDVARKIVDSETIENSGFSGVQKETFRPDTRASRVLRMSEEELEEERCRLLSYLMANKPDSVLMLSEIMQKNGALPGRIRPALKEHFEKEASIESERLRLAQRLDYLFWKWVRSGMEPSHHSASVEAITAASSIGRSDRRDAHASRIGCITTKEHFEQLFRTLETSAQMRETIGDLMRKTGVSPNLNIWKLLSNQLLIEGDEEGAVAISRHEVCSELRAMNKGLQEEFLPPMAKSKREKKNSLPGSQFQVPLLVDRLNDEQLSRVRSDRLLRLFAESSPTSRKVAEEFYATLQKNNAIDSYQRNIMLQYAAATSDEILALIEAGRGHKEEGVREHSGDVLCDLAVGQEPVPDISTYMTLVRQLLLEGNHNAAQNMIFGGIQNAGLKVIPKVRACLDISSGELSWLRRSKVAQLVKSGKSERAEAFLEKMVENGLGDQVGQLSRILNDPKLAAEAVSSFKNSKRIQNCTMREWYKTGCRKLLAKDLQRLSPKKSMSNFREERKKKQHRLEYNKKSAQLCRSLKDKLDRWNFGREPGAKVDAMHMIESALIEDSERMSRGEDRVLNAPVFHAFAKFAETSEEIQYMINVDMPAAKLQPDAAMYSLLVNMLVLEGNMEAAHKIVNEEMLALKIVPDKLIFSMLSRSPSDLRKRRHLRLNKGFKAKTPEGYRLAQSFFDRLRENGALSSKPFAGAFKSNKWRKWKGRGKGKGKRKANQYSPDNTALHNTYMRFVSDTSTEVRAFMGLPTHLDSSQIDKISSSFTPSFAIDAASFNILIAQLMMEGNLQAAKLTYDKEMKLLGHKGNKRTSSLLKLTDEDLAKMRRTTLNSMICQGKEKAALNMLSIMESNGVDTAPMHEYFNPKLVKNQNQNQIGFSPEEQLSRKLISCLERWRTTNDLNARMEAFEEFEKASNKDCSLRLDRIHFLLILKFLSSSEEQLKVIQTDMPKAGVRPDAACFNLVVNTLLIEGDISGARDIIEKKMGKFGISSNRGTQVELADGSNASEQFLERARSDELRKALVSSTSVGISRAESLFSKMRKHGVASCSHFELMLEYGCDLSDFVRDAIASGECVPRANTYDLLFWKLIVEGDIAAATELVRTDFHLAGLDPSFNMLRAIGLEEELLVKNMPSSDPVRGDVGAEEKYALSLSELDRRREMELRKMVLLGKVDEAKAFTKRLQDNGVILNSTPNFFTLSPA